MNLWNCQWTQSSELIGSFKFFPNRNEWKVFPMCSTWKAQGRLFYIEAKILDTNKQSSHENFNVIFSSELYIELTFKNVGFKQIF